MTCNRQSQTLADLHPSGMLFATFSFNTDSFDTFLKFGIVNNVINTTQQH